MINIKLIFKMLSKIIIIVGIFIFFMIPVAYYYKETKALIAFLYTVIVIFSFSVLGFFLENPKDSNELNIKGGFLFVTLSWVTIALIGAIPFYISGSIPKYVDAVFETMSGLTTTGASILTDIESVPRSLLLWRATTHWLGGMGIVVLTVAVLPLFGIDGLRLMQAESPGPVTNRLTTKIAKTAKYLWLIYIALTFLLAIILIFLKMDLVDAFSHSFATMATGGFSTKNISIAYYNSYAIDMVLSVFMILAGINFALHFRLITGDAFAFFKDSECKWFLIIIFVATFIITFDLIITKVYGSFFTSFRYSFFQAVSIVTTTGFVTADYEVWSPLAKYILFMLMFVGGCAGSTGGGPKVIRIISILKQSLTEIVRVIYPKGVFTVRVGGDIIDTTLIRNILGFMALYMLSLFLIALVVATGEHDILTSFSTALATLGNIGPGFMKVGPVENYNFFQDYIKWFLCFAMMLGRLEIYTVIAIVVPAFWKTAAK